MLHSGNRIFYKGTTSIKDLDTQTLPQNILKILKPQISTNEIFLVTLYSKLKR